LIFTFKPNCVAYRQPGLYLVSRHFGPRTFWHPGTSAEVPTSAELSRHIGTSVLRTLRQQEEWKTFRHQATLDQAMATNMAVLA